MLFKAMFFDFDGVMAETLPYHLPAWKRVVESRFDFPFNPMTVKLNEGRPVLGIARAVFEEAGHACTEEMLIEVVEQKNAIFRATHKAAAYPENFEIIRIAKKSGLKTGLVTGAKRENVHTLLSKELVDGFDVIIVDGDVERGKPFPDPYLTAAKRLGVHPEDCMVIENAPLGIRAAKAAGMFCVALKTTLSAEHLQSADVIFENHAQLLQNLSSLISQ